MSGTRKIVVDVPGEVYDELRYETVRRGQSIAYVIKNLIRSYLVEVESEPTGQYFRKAVIGSKKKKPKKDSP